MINVSPGWYAPLSGFIRKIALQPPPQGNDVAFRLRVLKGQRTIHKYAKRQITDCTRRNDDLRQVGADRKVSLFEYAMDLMCCATTIMC